MADSGFGKVRLPSDAETKLLLALSHYPNGTKLIQLCNDLGWELWKVRTCVSTLRGKQTTQRFYIVTAYKSGKVIVMLGRCGEEWLKSKGLI